MSALFPRTYPSVYSVYSVVNPVRESGVLPEHADELLLRLTPAERLVAIHVGHGLSNKEISSVLNRAEPTIKHQLASVLRKLGVQGRCQLIVLLLSGRRSFVGR